MQTGKTSLAAHRRAGRRRAPPRHSRCRGAASAAVTGAVTGDTATLTGDAAADTIIISINDGLLQHNLGTATGFADPTDFDSTVAGAADPDRGGRHAHDRRRRRRRQRRRPVPNNDHLIGGDGNDRLTGFTGDDDVDGGNGNDVMIWNNGDGSDTNDGDAGADETLDHRPQHDRRHDGRQQRRRARAASPARPRAAFTVDIGTDREALAHALRR